MKTVWIFCISVSLLLILMVMNKFQHQIWFHYNPSQYYCVFQETTLKGLFILFIEFF